MMNILDFHTHRLDAASAIISVDPRRFDPQPGLCYSVGFHPWHGLDELNEADFDLLAQCARHPQVVAIGETGMDRVRGAALDVQEQAFVRHLNLARALGKPVVAHCVKAAQDLLAARRRAGLDEVPLVIHGMRGNPNRARTLLDAGCYLSFGLRHNPAALQVTPLDRLLIETDDDPTATIHEVVSTIAASLGLTTGQLTDHVLANANRLLSEPHH